MMHLTRKKCPKCGSFRMIRKGHHNGSSYWYCKTCNRYSSGRKKPSQEAIFNRYSQGTFTIKELSQEFNISASTVKRILRNYTVTKVAHTHTEKW